MAAHRAHEEEDLLRRDGDLEPLEGAVDLLEGEHARARVVELEECVVQQQAAVADRLAGARHLIAIVNGDMVSRGGSPPMAISLWLHLRPQLEHGPLVLEGEELGERRLLPCLEQG